MKHAVRNIITPACRTNGYPERYVARGTQGRLAEAGVGPATSCTVCDGIGTDEFLTSAKQSKSQLYLVPFSTKRKYEDMTSSRIDEVEPENDHELPSKLSFFRENKRRKPPEAGNLVLMQVQVKVQDQSEDECQGSKRGSTPRSGSTSRVVITPDVCGESDLTAENLMAEESSRSSNNDGSSKFESAAESVTKGSTREPRSGSSLGVLHSFLDQPERKREVRIAFSETSAAYQRSLARNDDHISILNRQMEDVNESEGVPKLEPASFLPLGSLDEPQSGIHLTSSPENEKWLQLGVGPSQNTPPSSRLDPAMAFHRESPPFQQCNVERPYGKRKTPSLDLQISESQEPDSFSQSPIMAASTQRQAQRGSMLHKFEPKIDSSSTQNPPACVSLSRTTGVSEVAPNFNIEKDLGLFGSIFTAPGPQFVLAHKALPTGEIPVNSSDRNLDTMSSLLFGSADTRHQAEPQGSNYSVGAENLLLGGAGKSGIFSRTVPSSLSRPGDGGQFRSPQTAMDQSLQFQRESCQTPLAALMQTTGDQRQAAGHSWLPGLDSAQKLIPLANNFQGWSTDLNATTRAGTGSDQIVTERHSNQVDRQLQRASDDWESLFRRVSPSMLFPSQVQLTDGSSRMLSLDKNVATVSQEAQDSMGAFKRAIKFQNRTQAQWTITEPTNLGSVASWCLNGGIPLPGSRAEKLEIFGGERPVMSPMLPDRLPAQGRYPDIGQILSTKQAFQRQSWQPAAGQPKLQHGNVNILRGPRSPAPSVLKPRFQVLPPVSRGTSQAGLWFILQSAAENQLRSTQPFHFAPHSYLAFSQSGQNRTCVLPEPPTSMNQDDTSGFVLACGFVLASPDNIRMMIGTLKEEGGLPQITKAYLRIKDGKMPVSAVKKYLVTKLGLASEAEVEITCRGQPVVPSLPLQHVRDVIWYSSLNPSKDRTTTTSGSGDRDDSTSADQRVRPAANCNPAMFSKDVVMVLTYRRHPRTMPPQHC